MTPLVVPPAALRDDNSIQMISVWIAEKSLHSSLKIGMWKESGKNEVPAWGTLLADTIRHIANALQEEYGYSKPETIATILESLHNQLADPTTDVHGQFQHGHS